MPEKGVFRFRDVAVLVALCLLTMVQVGPAFGEAPARGSGSVPTALWFVPSWQTPTAEQRQVLARVAAVVPPAEVRQVAAVDLNGDGRSELAFRWEAPPGSRACPRATSCQRFGVVMVTPDRQWGVVVLREAGIMEIERAPRGQPAKVRFSQTPLTAALPGVAAEVWKMMPNGRFYAPSREGIPQGVSRTVIRRDSAEGQAIRAAVEGLARQEPEIGAYVRDLPDYVITQWRVTARRGQAGASTGAESGEEIALFPLVSGFFCGTSGSCPLLVLHRVQPRSPWRVVSRITGSEGGGEPFVPNPSDGRTFLVSEPAALTVYRMRDDGRLVTVASTSDPLVNQFAW